jgi:methanogenic corrinoid protein MtbC1
LRTWEARYGFPAPERRPSGHRVYPLAAVPRLRRIAEALQRGLRAGQVVGASESALSSLLAAMPRPDTPAAALAPAVSIDDLVRMVEEADGERLKRALLGDWARLEPLEFLEARVAPLVHAVGDAWERGRIDVSREHFASECLSDLLRALRLPFEERARGPLVVLATLPGEEHGLGAQMAALALSSAGLRVLQLGTEVPLHDLAELVKDSGASAVGVSVSAYTKGAGSSAQIRRLRKLVPRRVPLLVGGEGAPKPAPGVERLRSLRELRQWTLERRAGPEPSGAARPASGRR